MALFVGPLSGVGAVHEPHLKMILLVLFMQPIGGGVDDARWVVRGRQVGIDESQRVTNAAAVIAHVNDQPHGVAELGHPRLDLRDGGPIHIRQTKIADIPFLQARAAARPRPVSWGPLGDWERQRLLGVAVLGRQFDFDDILLGQFHQRAKIVEIAQMTKAVPTDVLRRAFRHEHRRGLAPVGDVPAVDLGEVGEALGEKAAAVGPEGDELLLLRLDEERQAAFGRESEVVDSGVAVDA